MSLFCFCPAKQPGCRSACRTGGWGNQWDSCTWRHTAEGQLAGGGDGRAAASLSIRAKALNGFHLLSSLSHCLHMRLFHLYFFFSSTLCVKDWLGSELQGCNLEETWDPITDTNTQSPHAAPVTASQPHAGHCGWTLSARHTTPCLLITLGGKTCDRHPAWLLM